MNVKQIRKKKVYQKWRVLDKNLYSRHYYPTAQIVLEGNYLIHAGFTPNQKLRIELMDGLIVIMPDH